MSAVLSLLPMALMCVLYALLIKLAARIYRRSILSWKHTFTFSVLALLVGGAGALLNYASNSILGPFLGAILGLAVQLALGGWYLGPRATAPTGTKVAFKGGAFIAAIAFGLVFTFAALTAVLVPMLRQGSQV
jgi:hypothetical protein